MFVGILVLTTYLGIIFWVTRDVTTRTKNLLGIFAAILLSVVFYIPGLLLYLLMRPLSTLDENNSLQLLSSVQDANLISCTDCHHTIRLDHDHCPYCGVKQNLTCPECKNRLHPEWQYCTHCGFNTQPKRNNILSKFKGYLLNNARKLRSALQKIKLPKIKRKAAIPDTLASASTPVSSAGIAANTIAKNTKTKEAQVESSKPIKLNKDGTPRKARSDAGKKRGNYKPRSS